jgi:CDP-glucose 4,6-dehydratase
MESLAMTPDFWNGRPVLVTGHTGFKGAWAAEWLLSMGARVSGLALAPEDGALFTALGLEGRMESVFADLCDQEAIVALLARAEPEIVIHMAAQALVRRSYGEPYETFRTNVAGTAALLHAISGARSVKAVVVVTSDKAYENREWAWGYRETDALGGRDPYSASKACTELAAASMRASYFQPYATKGHPAGIATARAGNVIGGGDWSADRLVPDIVRGCLGAEGAVTIRSPRAVRPWQHVLEPLRGYFSLAEAVVRDRDRFAEAWNFGPDRVDERPVLDVARAVIDRLGKGRLVVEEDPDAPHEAFHLTLDNSKARARLGWTPSLAFEDGIALTADWYRRADVGEDARALTLEQIAGYSERTGGAS